MEKVGHFTNFDDEVYRLRYIIAKFKEYDAKRKLYVQQLRQRIRELENLTEQQHLDMDALIEAYNCARPLIANPKEKATIYELIKRSRERDTYKQRCENQNNYISQLRTRIQKLETRIEKYKNRK